MLHVDSPGGSAVASDLIWRETVRMEEAVGGQHGRRGRQRRLLHRHGRQKIYAAPGTLTGSIGVIGGKLVTRGLYDKLGLNKEVIARGENGGSVIGPAIYARGAEGLARSLEDTYHQFVGQAAAGRKMTYDDSKHWLGAGSTRAGPPKSSA